MNINSISLVLAGEAPLAAADSPEISLKNSREAELEIHIAARKTGRSGMRGGQASGVAADFQDPGTEPATKANTPKKTWESRKHLNQQ